MDTMGGMNRRGFLLGILAVGAAPAIIRTPGLIMPIKPLSLNPRAALDEILGGRDLSLMMQILDDLAIYGRAFISPTGGLVSPMDVFVEKRPALTPVLPRPFFTEQEFRL